MTAPLFTTSEAEAVERLLAHAGPRARVGAPLGLGKPHRFLNALYHRVADDPRQQLLLMTALSLTPPRASGLQARFLDPFVRRHFGDDFVRLSYVDAQRAGTLPDNVTVEEFYLQSGGLLGVARAQHDYASINYTQVAPELARRGLDAIVQKVAREPSSDPAAPRRLSLSCNTDLTFDLVDAFAALGKPRPLLVAEIDPDLPYLGGAAAVPADWFDVVIDPPGPSPRLFALPRQPVSDTDYAIGLLASTLVRDGGTLQIGIGTLSDALCHALLLRHRDNATYRRLVAALAPGIERHPAVLASGGLGTFAKGLYGASEMISEGFMHLFRGGVLARAVVEDEAAMRRLDAGTATDEDRALVERTGVVLHGAFYLGSADLYRWLRELSPDEARRIGMQRISQVNELYGGNERLERAQRRDARFFNTCMMMTALGSAVSDGLESGQIISGVGGQYNFVAMAHALPDARSVLMFRATRKHEGKDRTNVPFAYGHCTIPRHLRDVAVTEYGVADLRGATDAACLAAMRAIADARFDEALAAEAERNGKLSPGARTAAAPRNTPERIAGALGPFRRAGVLPDYPLGSDFTPLEERLVKALGWLRDHTATTSAKAALAIRALAARAPDAEETEALARLDLASPRHPRERLEGALVTLALRRTS